MKLYVTSCGPDPKQIKYLGTSLEEAIEAVNFTFVDHYEIDPDHIFSWPTRRTYPEIYTALPSENKYEYIKYYEADGWWYSIVKVLF